MSRQRKTNAILQALLTNKTIKSAALAANVSERVMYNYLRDPSFAALYQSARDVMIREISYNLVQELETAVSVISDIMLDCEQRTQDRLSAARLMLEFGDRYYQSSIIAGRISELERQLKV